eukprot:TRINITY_DN16401_c0_g1_i1.p1 TRINITY_DN16401_c0_g1~~TRINITY_DN16401_c0_g1_i1.p1  ORF type:complete len:141 (-),score=12.53 TRINITY_DN16401_c0_g1_i1:80-502(-)
MGQKPSVTLAFQWDAGATSVEAVYDGLKHASQNLAHWDLIRASDDDHILTCMFQTPACGWLDHITIHVEERDDHIVTTGTSYSTNVCPGWCGCLRTACGGLNAFSDHGQNIAHLRQIVGAAGIEARPQEFLVSHVGLSKV